MSDFIFKPTLEYEAACADEIIERGRFLYYQDLEGERDVLNYSLYDLECFYCFLGYKLAMDAKFSDMTKKK